MRNEAFERFHGLAVIKGPKAECAVVGAQHGVLSTATFMRVIARQRQVRWLWMQGCKKGRRRLMRRFNFCQMSESDIWLSTSYRT